MAIDEAIVDKETIPYRTVQGVPDGPEIDHPYLGKVPTFLSENRDADRTAATSKFSAKVLPNLPRLMYHVPLDMRGPYKIPPGTKAAFGERLGPANYAMCNGVTTANNQQGEIGRACKAKAVNRSGLCARHGGMLNPADRQRIDWDRAPRHIKFKYGMLKAEELDDDELARGQIRLEDGSYTKNDFVSAEIHQEFKARLFERGDVLLREAYLDAVRTFAEVAKNDIYEPSDRLKAAEFIFTRLRGKIPDIIELRADKPFENVMMKLVGGSREDSRSRRGGDEEPEDVIDAEVVEELKEYAGSGDFLLTEAEAEEAFTDDGDLKVYDDGERLADEFRPEPATWNGPVKPSKDIPQDVEIRDEFEKKQAKNNDDADRKRQALLRKAHKQKMNAALKKRKWAQKEGFEHMPVAPKMVVFEEDEYEESEDEVTIRLEF